MGARKVSNSKSDLQGQSTALAIVPFDEPHRLRFLIGLLLQPCLHLAQFPR